MSNIKLYFLSRPSLDVSSEVFYIKGILKNFAKFTGKHLRLSPFFKVCNFIKKRFWHRCSPMNFAKTSGRLLLYIMNMFDDTLNETNIKKAFLKVKRNYKHWAKKSFYVIFATNNLSVALKKLIFTQRIIIIDILYHTI